MNRHLAAAALATTLAAASCGPSPIAPPPVGGEAQAGDPPTLPLDPPAGAQGAATSGLPEDLRGTAWEWIAFASGAEAFAIGEPARYRIAFVAPDRLTLRADCNHGGARAGSPGEGRLSIGPVALTRAACADGGLGARLAQGLARAVIYSVQGDRLLIELPADSGSFAFRRARG